MATRTRTRYHDPADVDEAVSLLADLGSDATVLAGGQDLVRAMNLGDIHPANIVDVSGLPDLDTIESTGGTIEIGALVTHEELANSSIVEDGCPLFVDAKATIGGGQQIHNRGTVGGALCAAEPAYDYPSCLVALDGTLVVRSADGSREIPAAEFFEDAGETALQSEELLTGIRLPELVDGVATSYEKLKYTEGCYNIASAAATVDLDGDTLTDVRLALGGIEPRPRRLDDAESLATGEQLDTELLTAVSESASDAVESPVVDIHADADYRRSMAGVMAKRALETATERVRAATDGGTTEDTS
jgi:carbon-monoxide dehydrogenase medium subunit